MRRGPPPLFFFGLSLFKSTKICFGSTKMEIFYREKAFHAAKKIRKNDFASSEKFSCCAPGEKYISGPRYWNIPLLVNTRTVFGVLVLSNSGLFTWSRTG